MTFCIGNPSRPNSVSPSRSSSSLLLEWKHFDVCYHNIHYKVSFSSEHGGGRAETLQVIEANITIEGLVPNTAYTVIIRAVSVTVESVPLQLSIITLSECLTYTHLLLYNYIMDSIYIIYTHASADTLYRHIHTIIIMFEYIYICIYPLIQSGRI